MPSDHVEMISLKHFRRSWKKRVIYILYLVSIKIVVRSKRLAQQLVLGPAMSNILMNFVERPPFPSVQE